MVRQERMEQEAKEQELDVEYEVKLLASLSWSAGCCTCHVDKRLTEMKTLNVSLSCCLWSRQMFLDTLE